MGKLTLKHLSLISHSLGIRLIESVMSHKLIDKTLPKVYYRNYFNTNEGTTDYPYIKELVDMGVMEEFRSEYYGVTDLGKELFASQFKEITNYQPVSKRDIEYLKHRINFYSGYMGYRFCDDNSEHIISAYQNYTLKGFCTSHTTSDVINRFKPELRKHFKKQSQP